MPQLFKRHSTCNGEITAVHLRQMGERNCSLFQLQWRNVTPLLQVFQNSKRTDDDQ